MNFDCIIKNIIKPDILLIIILAIMICVNKLFFRLNYFSVGEIIKGHFDCFRGYDNKILIIPLINNIFIPLLLAGAAAFTKEINDSLINLITIIVSIITAMLFTLLSMVIEMKSNIKKDPNYYSREASISKKALIQTYSTIMYEILISVMLLIFCLYNAFTNDFSIIKSYIIYFLSFSLILNLLMVIKRIYKVIDIDIKK